MSKTKKLAAAALATLAITAVPATSVAVSGGTESVQLACGGTSGGCQG